MLDPTLRFSSRVENYIKYRPSYPPGVLEILKEECRFTSESIIADVGSGTGILAELLLKNGNRVYGVEPNREMREAGERFLRHYSSFKSVAGKAESTLLADASVNFVTAGQAFHWFDRGKAREEFSRILKPGGWVVLIWNERRTDATPFLREYEKLLRSCAIDYEAVDHKQVDETVLRSFFGPAGFQSQTLDNQQVFDFESLKGRVLSASYVPEAGHPNYEPMLAGLRVVFEANQIGGRVRFDYATRVYFGRLSSPRC